MTCDVYLTTFPMEQGGATYTVPGDVVDMTHCCSQIQSNVCIRNFVGLRVICIGQLI